MSDDVTVRTWDETLPRAERALGSLERLTAEAERIGCGQTATLFRRRAIELRDAIAVVRAGAELVH